MHFFGRRLDLVVVMRMARITNALATGLTAPDAAHVHQPANRLATGLTAPDAAHVHQPTAGARAPRNMHQWAGINRPASIGRHQSAGSTRSTPTIP